MQIELLPRDELVLRLQALINQLIVEKDHGEDDLRFLRTCGRGIRKYMTQYQLFDFHTNHEPMSLENVERFNRSFLSLLHQCCWMTPELETLAQTSLSQISPKYGHPPRLPTMKTQMIRLQRALTGPSMRQQLTETYSANLHLLIPLLHRLNEPNRAWQTLEPFYEPAIELLFNLLDDLPPIEVGFEHIPYV